MFNRRRKTHTGSVLRQDSQSMHGRQNRNSLMTHARTQSMPNFHPHKGVMKYVTADDSLHSKYGESKEKDAETKDSDRHIEFKDLLIREFARTVGDNPSCSSGPPVAIAWEYNPETKVIAVDQYEKCRPPRRTHFEMVLPRSVRQDMLRKEWEVSQAQIASAVRNNIKIKNQRRTTVRNLGKSEKMEEMMESAGKKVMRGLFFTKSTDKQVAELERKLEETERARQNLRSQQHYSEEYEGEGSAESGKLSNASSEALSEPEEEEEVEDKKLTAGSSSSMNTADSPVES